MEVKVQVASASARIARASDRVFKDECMFSFDSPFSTDGLFTNLSTFQSFGQRYILLDRLKHPNSIYLHRCYKKVPKEKAEEKTQTPSKLAIGSAVGGFAADEEDRYDVERDDRIAIFTKESEDPHELPLHDAAVPQNVKESVESVLQHAGNTVSEEVATWEEQRKVTKYADKLVQLPNATKVSSDPSKWQCKAGDCDKKENLWMNLSDGYIGCGRRNWDGSGGCGEALRHYDDTGKQFPLSVKLGTITAEGGDVYSYAADEDDMVIDPHLSAHLAHFGINVNQMKKTDKSMDELQVGLNMLYEFDKITEAGNKLQPVTGAGYIGFKNLGNSCYMNSTLQLLLAMTEVQNRYLEPADVVFQSAPDNPSDDLPTQLAKLAKGVLTDRYRRTIEDGQLVEEWKDPELRPTTFRSLVGRGHPDFSSNQQQDAVEYLFYLLDVMQKSERTSVDRIGALIPSDAESKSTPTSQLFRFALEDRVQCLASKQVKYVSRDESMLQMPIPIDCATNQSEVQAYLEKEQKRQRTDDNASGEAVVPKVPFEACLRSYFATETIHDFLSPATKQKGDAEKVVRLKSYPRYLLLQMRRFYVSDDWTPKKMDVSVDVPETFSLPSYLSASDYKARGPQPDETLLPEDEITSASESQEVEPDETLVMQLISMGFPINGCKRAAIATNNGSPEAAMEWVLAHMEDADFNDPPAAKTKTPDVNTELVSTLMAMGFTDEQATVALKKTDQNPDRAAEWLFSHMDDLDAAVASVDGQQSNARGLKRLDVEAEHEYELMGFVSHIGKNVNSGHYVAHMKKEGRWVIFNDDKVALSEYPPFDSGYLYLFRRKDIA